MFKLIGEIVLIIAIIYIIKKYIPETWKNWIKAKFQKIFSSTPAK